MKEPSGLTDAPHNAQRGPATSPEGTNLPEALPSYGWAGVDVNQLARAHPTVPALPSTEEWPAIPDLFSDSSGSHLPSVQPSALGAREKLVAVSDRRVRDLAAYWHSGWPYAVPVGTLRESAHRRLVRASEALPDGFGFAVFDAWRDPRLQRSLHTLAYQDGKLEPGFVSPPSADPLTPPPHATGGTVDLTLTWHGVPLNLGTRFDEFVPRAHTRALESVEASGVLHAEPRDGEICGGDITARNLRRLLRSAMTSVGFVQLDCEWWHFEYGTRLWAKLKGQEPLYPRVDP